MGFCTSCGQQLPNRVNFCPNCGTAVYNDTVNNSVRRTVFEGDQHKCPYCGEFIDSFTMRCPSCNREIRNSPVSNAFDAFSNQLIQARTKEQRNILIRSFAIPNTKEDVNEFMILASSNLGTSLDNDELEAWKSIIDRTYQKAHRLYNNDSDFSELEINYETACQRIKSINAQRKKVLVIQKAGHVFQEILPVILNVIGIAFWLLSLFIIIPFCSLNVDFVGTNGYQLLFMVDVIAGVFFIPLITRTVSALPQTLAISGLGMSLLILFPLCNTLKDHTGASPFQLLFVVDLVCTIIIIVRSVQSRPKPNDKVNSNTILAMMCFIVILLIAYGTSYLIAPKVVNASTESDYTESKQTFEWPETGLSLFLPQPDSEYGEIKTDNNERFSFELYQATAEQFESYVKECKQMGFTIGETKTDSIFYSHNSEKYSLDIFYFDYDSTITVYLDAPMKMAEIRWPNNELVNQIPKPIYLVGNISTEKSDCFGVYIDSVSNEQFNEYVDECISAGFDIDYVRDDDYFSAFNNRGTHLSVEKEIFNVMCIFVEEKE